MENEEAQKIPSVENTIKTIEIQQEDQPPNFNSEQLPNDADNDAEKNAKNESLSKKEQRRADKIKISLLNYNLFMRPALINKIGKDHRRLRFEIIKCHLSTYNVLNFQEIFGTLTRKRSQLIEHAKFLGFDHTSVPPKNPTFSQFLVDSGLLTLSKS